MAWSRADSACLRELRRADVRAKRARPRETGMGLEFWSRLSRRGVINWLTDGAGGRGDTRIRVLTAIITILSVDLACYGGFDGTIPARAMRGRRWKTG